MSDAWNHSNKQPFCFGKLKKTTQRKAEPNKIRTYDTLVLHKKDTRGGVAAHYGKFENVKNYIAVVGKNSADLSEKAGYYGEKLVLVIAIGYGKTQGRRVKAKRRTRSARPTSPHPNGL